MKISAAGERRGKEGIKEEKGRGERRRRVEGRGGEGWRGEEEKGGGERRREEGEDVSI